MFICNFLVCVDCGMLVYHCYSYLGDISDLLISLGDKGLQAEKLSFHLSLFLFHLLIFLQSHLLRSLQLSKLCFVLVPHTLYTETHAQKQHTECK